MLGVSTLGPVGPVGPGGPVASAAGPADERDAWAILASIDGLGPIAFAALLARYGSGRAVIEDATRPGAAIRLAATPSLDLRDEPPDRARRPVGDVMGRVIADAVQRGAHVLERLAEVGVRVVILDEPAYPVRLAKVAMPPHVLFVTGDAAALGRPRAVAVVGTRRPSTSGRTAAGRIATALVAVDAVVVSGLAHGIDGVAHETTVRAGGVTVAVIGSGHACVSPRSHQRLAEAIVRAGGAVVSELAPDVEPTRGTFPRRNRIISGLSQATVVVEAPARSGALITASWALEQGRECFLVPGPIDAPTAAGCLAFLREFGGAARIVAGVPQLIADLGLAGTRRGADAAPVPSDAVVAASLATLGRTEGTIAQALLEGLRTVDELVAATGHTVSAVLSTLALLERRGLVAGLHGRYRPDGALLGVARMPKPR